MKHRRVWTKVLAVLAIVYGLSRVESGLRMDTSYAKGLQDPSGGALPAAGPDLHFPELAHDFGDIAQDEKVTHAFRFENRGSQTLEIQEVRGSCGCTAALVSDKNVPPGGSGTIEVTFDSKFKKGAVNKTVTVTSNDPDNPQTVLTITGHIRTLLEVEPIFVSFGNNLPKGQQAEQRMRLWRPDGQSFQVLKLESDNPNVQLAMAPFTENERRGVEVVATLLPGMPPGRHSGSLKLQTDIARVPETLVRYYAGIKGDVQLEPKHVLIGTIAAGEGATRTLRVQTVDAAGTELKILAVEPQATWLSGRVEMVEEGKAYELVVTVSKDAPEGSLRSEVVLTTNLPDEPQVRVPVFGYVGQSASIPSEEQEQD